MKHSIMLTLIVVGIFGLTSGCKDSFYQNWWDLSYDEALVGAGFCPVDDTPTLNNDSKAAVICSLEDGIRWTSIAGAYQYEIQFSETKGDFNKAESSYRQTLLSLITTGTTLPGSKLFIELDLLEQSNPGSIPPNLDLFYRVRSYVTLQSGADCTSIWSEEGSVQISRTAPSLLQEPLSKSVNCDGFPTFSWTATPIANADPTYVLEISTDGTFQTTNFRFEGITETQYIPAEPILNQVYFWRVLYQEAYCEQWSSNTFELVVNYIEQPIVLSTASTIPECDKTPLIEWESVANASGYELEVWESGDAMMDTSGLIYSYTITGGSTDSHNVLQSLPNGSYQYRLRGYLSESECKSDWTEAEGFTIMSTVATPEPTTAGALDDEDWICTTDAPFGYISWLPAAEASQYRLQITNRGDGKNDPTAWQQNENDPWDGVGLNPDMSIPNLLVDTVLTTTSFDLSQLVDVDEGTFYWRVAGKNGICEGEFSPVWSFSYDLLPVPELTAPLDGELVCSLQPTLSWETVDWTPLPGGVYQVQISPNQTFTTITQSTTISAESFNLGTPLGVGTYYWRVRVKTQHCTTQSDYSTPRMMDVKPEVEYPVSLQPGTPATICTTSVNLKWTTVWNADSYHVQVSDDTEFDTILTESTLTHPDSVFNYTFPGSGAGDYYWQVKAYNPDCSSDYTPLSIIHFTDVPAPNPDTTGFVLERVSGGFRASWDHPSFDPYHDLTLLLRKTGGFPTDENDVLADVVYDGPDNSVTDPTISLFDGETYFYRAFACNYCSICTPIGPGASLMHDATPPTVTLFQIDTSDPTSLSTLPITLTADDLGGTLITHYLITESAVKPSANTMRTEGDTSAPTEYTLDDPDTVGLVNLFAWVIDEAGNISSAGNASITRDDGTPYGSIDIVPTVGFGTAEFTSNEEVTLSLTMSTNAQDMWISNSSTIPNLDPTTNDNNTGWVSVQTSWPPSGSWKLCTTCVDGAKTVYVKFRTSSLVISSSPMTDVITLDTESPTLTQFLVNGSSTAISTPNSYIELTLNGLNGTGSLVEWMRFRQIQPTIEIYSPWETAVIGPTGYTLPSTSDTYQLEVELEDSAMNLATFTSPTITLDTGIPTGELFIQAKDPENAPTDQYTTENQVDLIMTYDANVNEMWISNDPDFQGPYPALTNTGWISASTSFDDWFLSAGEGYKSIYIRYRSGAGVLSSVIADHIVFDHTEPAAPTAIYANVGAETNVSTPLWYWYAVSDASRYRYSFTDGTGWTETNTTYFVPGTALTNGQTYTLYVQAGDGAGNWSTTSMASSVTIDLNAPTSPTVTVNTGTSTNNPRPIWSWTDISDAITYRYSFTDGSGWQETTEPYFRPESNLSENTYRLYVQARDAAGNWSSSGSSNAINIDLTPPSVPSVTLVGSSITNNPQPTWNWGAVSGAVKYRYSYTEGSGWVETTNLTYSANTILNNGDSYTLYVQARDGVGNWSASGSDTVTIDTQPPDPISSILDNVEQVTQNKRPIWSWVPPAGATKYEYSMDEGSTWTTTFSSTFQPGSDLTSFVAHEIWVRAGDDAGNWSNHTESQTIYIVDAITLPITHFKATIHVANIAGSGTYTAVVSTGQQVSIYIEYSVSGAGCGTCVSPILVGIQGTSPPHSYYPFCGLNTPSATHTSTYTFTTPGIYALRFQNSWTYCNWMTFTGTQGTVFGYIIVE